jgi:hypothetical protein
MNQLEINSPTESNQLKDSCLETSLCIQEQTAIVEWPLPLQLSPLTKSSSSTAATTSSHVDHGRGNEGVQRVDDFVGSASAVKALFTLPSNLNSSNTSECLAVHRVGYVFFFFFFFFFFFLPQIFK